MSAKSYHLYNEFLYKDCVKNEVIKTGDVRLIFYLLSTILLFIINM